MLEINNLHVKVEDKLVLKGINLSIKKGEIHAIMGPNGSGKSTLSYVLAGKGGYEIVQGEVRFFGKDLLALTPEERAHAGMFLGFQYPVELPGVNAMSFLKASYNAMQKVHGHQELDSFEFLKLVRQKLKDLQMDEVMLKRSVNSGFSGGEKKRYEMLQLTLLNPKLTILDEIDSGLDIDALQTVAQCINQHHTEENALLIITHYQRLLDYITPDKVHILVNGAILKSGDHTLALELESKGYQPHLSEAPKLSNC